VHSLVKNDFSIVNSRHVIYMDLRSVQFSLIFVYLAVFAVFFWPLPRDSSVFQCPMLSPPALFAVNVTEFCHFVLQRLQLSD